MRIQFRNPADMTDKNLYYACCTAYLAAVSFGLAIGYTSPALPDMRRNEILTETEGAWFASILNIGALLGSFAAGWMIEKYGRKLSLMFLTLPFITGWCMISIGPTVAIMHCGRLLTGFGGGMVGVVAPVYIAEISNKESRGMLGAGVQLGITVGILISYVLGMFCSWNTIAFIAGVIALLQLVQSYKIVDTPRYLLMNGSKQDTLQALAWLRGPVADIDEECRDIEENLPDKSETFSLKEFSKHELYAPLKVSVGLACFQQLTGINAVMFFTVSIFESAGHENGQTATVIVGLVQVIFTIVACFLMDKAGRRLLLMIAGVGMALSCFTLGYYYYSVSLGEGADLSWLALASLIGYIIAFSLGWGPIPMLIMSEIFPVKSRGAASAISISMSWTVSFIITNQFVLMQGVIGAYGEFWLFGAFCCLGTLFVFRMVPETKGKSLEDIELHFLGRAMRHV